MAKKNAPVEEPTELVTPAVEENTVEETTVEETPIEEIIEVFSRSNGFDLPKPEPEQIGHRTRIFRAGIVESQIDAPAENGGQE